MTHVLPQYTHAYLCREHRETGKEQEMKPWSLSSCKVTLFPKVLPSKGIEQGCTLLLLSLVQSPPRDCADGMKLLVMFTCLTGQLGADDLWIWKEKKQGKLSHVLPSPFTACTVRVTGQGLLQGTPKDVPKG